MFATMPGDRSATVGSYSAAVTPSSSASRARSLRKARSFVSICQTRAAKSKIDPPAWHAP